MQSSEGTNIAGGPVQSNRAALLIVFLVVFIDLLGFGIVLPMLPRFADDYVKHVVPGGTAPEAFSGLIVGALFSSFSLMQFVFAPLWGGISDRIGRRPILLLGLCGSVAFYALFGWAASFPAETHASTALTLFFAARIGAGIAGATISTAQAVIADSTPPEKRRHGMALIGAAFGIGFTFGPLIGFGVLRLGKWMGWGEASHALIGYSAAMLSLVALILACFLLPETRRFDSASPLEKRWVSFAAIRWALGSSAIGPVVLTFFLASLGFGSFETTLALLLKSPFQFDEDTSLLVFVFVGLVLVIAQGFLYRRLAKRWTEVTFITTGIVLMAGGVALLGAVSYLATPGTDMDAGAAAANARQFTILLYPALTLAVVGFAFLTPSAQALVSRRTDADHQGEILGVNQSASAMARILGPLIGIPLYKATPDHILPYIFGAGLLILMLPLIPRMRRG